jgi:hypothetical protein
MSIQSEGRSVRLAVPANSEEGIKHLAQMHEGIGNVPGAVVKFKKVLDYTTFDAEYSLLDGNVVVHFFMPSRSLVTQEYWKDRFADVLTAVAQEHFQATSPRLVAKYAEDDGAGGTLNSWWFKAQGYGHLLDPDAFMVKFFDKMDTMLDAHFSQHSRPKPTAAAAQ